MSQTIINGYSSTNDILQSMSIIAFALTAGILSTTIATGGFIGIGFATWLVKRFIGIDLWARSPTEPPNITVCQCTAGNGPNTNGAADA